MFSDRHQPQVVANAQFVGSISTRSDTWLWSWANPSIAERVRADIRKVRDHGNDHQFLKLAAARWTASESDGWEMAAVAAFLLGAEGAYRSRWAHSLTFMILTDVGWAH